MSMRLTKNKMSKQIVSCLKKYPLIDKYFSDVAHNIVNNPRKIVEELLELQLIRYLTTKDEVLANLERHLDEKEFTNISIPINRLKTNFSEYSSVMAELSVAKMLKDEGMTNILFIGNENNPDIQYTNNGIVQYAEVKNLDDLDPEFPILNNKLEAASVLDVSFRKDFYIRLNDISKFFNRLKDYKKALNTATDGFIKLLKNEMHKTAMEDLIIPINNFVFTVSFKSKRPGYHLMYGGEVMKYGSNKDVFLKMSSVYSRFINSSADGIKQLANKRGKNLEGIKNDRLYIFLNSGRHANFVPDELEGIISKMSEVLGINDMVTLKVQL